MAELSQLSNTNTLSTQHSAVVPVDPQLPSGVPPAVDPNAAEVPAKRKPGRPKGSGRKPVDPDAPPKFKRPVGRPRKDGLPAGSVGAKKPSPRNRKRPPGKFAVDGSTAENSPSHSEAHTPSFPAWSVTWNGVPTAFPSTESSISVGPSTRRHPIDPSLESSGWDKMSRSDPSGFLHALVAALAAPNPVSTMGPSVEEAFQSHLKSLAPAMNNCSSQIPTLYSILKTFWLPMSPAYFALTASASTARTPSEHRFLYWDPQPLVFNGIACPSCAVPLTNRGRIASGPIKVYDLGRPFFVIGCEYGCKATPQCAAVSPEGRKFSSVDQSVLRALPEKLREEFPAHLVNGGADIGCSPTVWNWRAMGVSKELLNMVKGCLRLGAGRDAILQIIRGIQQGVPDEPLKPEKQEEEEEPEEVNDSDESDGEGATQSIEPPDAYADAWKANSGTADVANQPDETSVGTSRAVTVPPDQAPQDPLPQVPVQSAPPSTAVPTMAPAPPIIAYTHGYPTWGYQQNPQTGQFVALHPAPPSDPAAGLKRAYSVATEGAFDANGGEPAQKRTRHCCKCGSQDCKGKGGRNFCNNPCQDCGKLDCKGRNSKRPDKTCVDAWI